MDYTLALKLKDAGFPQIGGGIYWYLSNEISRESYDLSSFQEVDSNAVAYLPTLEEIIESCEKFMRGTDSCISIYIYPHTNGKGWGEEPIEERRKVFAIAHGWRIKGEGSDPLEAVANLWLALNK